MHNSPQQAFFWGKAHPPPPPPRCKIACTWIIFIFFPSSFLFSDAISVTARTPCPLANGDTCLIRAALCLPNPVSTFAFTELKLRKQTLVGYLLQCYTTQLVLKLVFHWDASVVYIYIIENTYLAVWGWCLTVTSFSLVLDISLQKWTINFRNTCV